MDRRSFDLNYENNILFYDPTLTAEIRRRQDSYLALFHPVTAAMVAQWSMARRLWNNTIAMLGPITVKADRPKETCTSNFKPSSLCFR